MFLMHTVKGKKITVIHLLRACWHQTFFPPSIREGRPFFWGEHQLATPRAATTSWRASPGRRAGTRHRAIWAGSAQIFGFGEARRVNLGPGGQVREALDPLHRDEGPEEQARILTVSIWQHEWRGGDLGSLGTGTWEVLGSSQPGRVPGRTACRGRC